ncbi:hypothetical protein RJ53_01220 [Methanocalculus chunghsingensis]|uniref:DNA mismatch repair protein MutL n=2 Tax=Methanocalculus chunghsingensis TaxID=156457 RepID=A0A8J8B4M2_9EURY|nr:hypothetical protein [Methanocalculus chunghsingensis]
MDNPVIHILDEETVSHIAAGEVVERPASVVKELVENAIDAGASRIRIDIRSDRSEVRRIIVTDNGIGMSPDDAERAFRQHATSKIKTADDLGLIRTLGFRGEALASIAAISEVVLSTRRRDDIAGTEVHLSGGAITSVSECGTPPGTILEVSGLFFNTPARRKFQRTISTELAHIFDMVERTALSHPGVSFQLLHQEKEKFRTSGRGDLLDTIQSLFGADLSRRLIEVLPAPGGISISGFIAYPLVSQRGRSSVYLSVNGRQITSPSLARAIRDGFGESLPKGEYPFAVIDCRMDPEEVDVNVHPTKKEVRFSSERAVADTVRGAVRSALTTSGSFQVPEIRQNPAPVPIRDGELHHPEPVLRTASGAVEFPRQPVVAEGKGIYGRTDRQLRQTELPRKSQEIPPIPSVLGQIDGTYILAAGKDGGLLIIDQHAAHEKIVYDNLRKQTDGTTAYQHLLEPVTISLSRKDSALLKDALEDIASAGIILEEFGGDTWMVRAVPADGVKLEEADEIRSLLLELIEGVRGPAGDRRLRMYQTIACRAAIKGNTLLSQEQMERLLSQLFTAAPPYTCPHGRPAVISYAPSDLEQLFRRR